MIRRWHRHHTASTHMIAHWVACPNSRSLNLSGMEVLAYGVVRVIVKPLILPERVHARRDVPLASAQTAERGNMLVLDPGFAQHFGERFRVVLWVGACDRGMVRTSTMSRTSALLSKSTNSSIERVEWPIVHRSIIELSECARPPRSPKRPRESGSRAKLYGAHTTFQPFVKLNTSGMQKLAALRYHTW